MNSWPGGMALAGIGPQDYDVVGLPDRTALQNQLDSLTELMQRLQTGNDKGVQTPRKAGDTRGLGYSFFRGGTVLGWFPEERRQTPENLMGQRMLQLGRLPLHLSLAAREWLSSALRGRCSPLSLTSEAGRQPMGRRTDTS